VTVALGLVLGANVGSGMLAMLVTSRGKPEVRRLPLGNLIFKAAARCWPSRCWARRMCCCSSTWAEVHQQVVLFHLGFNVCWRCSSASPARWRGWSSAAAQAGGGQGR
jgi:phosphate:Na+ symporter